MSDWQWFGNAGHFVGSSKCRFHLCTRVGDVLVSTVGQYLVHEGDRHFTEIGVHRKYETMVFRVDGPPCSEAGCDCGMPRLRAYKVLESAGYNGAGAATEGHLELCRKWDKKERARGARRVSRAAARPGKEKS